MFFSNKAGKIKKAAYNDPLEALVYAVLAEYMKASAAKAAHKKIFSHFVDFNDLRVSRSEELIEVIGPARADVNEIAKIIKGLLQAIFIKYDRLSLAELSRIGKRQAREVIEKLESASPFVVNYVVLTVLNGHAVPLTKKMIVYLKEGNYVHPDADEKDITSFLERQITASNAYTFYVLLRKACESHKKTVKKTIKNKMVKKQVKPKTPTKKEEKLI